MDAGTVTAWVADLRRVIVWTLGIVLILDAVTSSSNAVPELIVGLVMVGVLPLEDVVMTYARARGARNGGHGDG